MRRNTIKIPFTAEIDFRTCKMNGKENKFSFFFITIKFPKILPLCSEPSWLPLGRDKNQNSGYFVLFKMKIIKRLGFFSVVKAPGYTTQFLWPSEEFIFDDHCKTQLEIHRLSHSHATILETFREKEGLLGTFEEKMCAEQFPG